jgi:tight adherence protein C
MCGSTELAVALLILGGVALTAYAWGMRRQWIERRFALIMDVPRSATPSVLQRIVRRAADLTPGWVKMLVARRRTVAIMAGLPDALELMVICVEAGLSLEEALSRTAQELRHARPWLARELDMTSADLRISSNRDDALANLASRVSTPAIRSLATALSQTLRYGTPLAQALRSMATEMRNEAMIALEERTNRLPALMTVPMMLFIMPTIFLIVGGPAALHVIDTFLR